MTSDQRVDAVVWASCSLVRMSKRPRICYEPIVTEFYRRYMFKESDVLPQADHVAVNSSSEAELLRLLNMASDSTPLHRVVCVEAFEVSDTDLPVSLSRTPTVFGCGSPSTFRSEFIGMENPSIAQLLDRMAWLTADAITVMSTRYLIRQNCFTQYDVEERADDGRLVLASHTGTNFSSFGQLYALLIVIGLTLLTLNCLSSLELVKWMSFPKYSEVKIWTEQREAAQSVTHPAAPRHDKPEETPFTPRRSFLWHARKRLAALNVRVRHADFDASVSPPAQQRLTPRIARVQRRRRLLATMEAMSGVAAIEEEQLYSFFSRSLYRNPRIVVITLTTQLISWLLGLPNAVIWMWSKSTDEKLQAYLGSIRCWVLLLILCNMLWSGVVRVSERAAYAITKRTFLTSVDMVCIASLVSFLLRPYVFSMSEEKWQLEHQRVNDVTSFVGGYLAHGNTFHNALDSVDMTSTQIFGILYGPLARILATGVCVAIGVLMLKAFYFSRQRRVLLRRAQRQVAMHIEQLSRRLSKTSNSSVLDGSSTAIRRSGSTGTDSFGTWEGEDDDDIADQEKALLQALREPYHRLPLEEWLDQPIRATSLIRYGLRMETVRDTTRFIRPSCYLDFGIIVKRGVIHSRIGFADSWKPRMTVQEYMTPVEHQDPPGDGFPPPSVPETTRLDRSPDSHLRLSSNARLKRQDSKRKQSLHVPLA